MTVGEVKAALDKWPDDKEVTAWFREEENLEVCAVNVPARLVPDPILWIARKVDNG